MKEGEIGHNSVKDTSLSLKDNSIYLSYRKTNKLTTALYMVTDILDMNEPIRLRLRTLGVEILSDITSTKVNIITVNTIHKIQEVLYFLDLAETMRLISQMNASILKKEFIELKRSIQSYKENSHLFAGKSTLTEFFEIEDHVEADMFENKRNYSIGHINPTNIGVQKGSTLMKALSDRITRRPIETNTRPLEKGFAQTNIPPKKELVDFDLLKKQRRYEIVQVIKDFTDGASITDIKSKSIGLFSSTSEKTLQRELVAMVEDGVLKKVGTKRWSRYSLLQKI